MSSTEPRRPEIERLEAFVGDWTLEVPFATGVRATCSFEWLAGERFLVQRWEVDVPEAPDGIAIIGFDADKGRYAQHYFDSRGVARLYEMSFEDGVWKLWRDWPGFSQRYEGTFSADGNTIDGRWEISTDDATWEKDFDLKYRRV
jgi:hypothetical protein